MFWGFHERRLELFFLRVLGTLRGIPGRFQGFRIIFIEFKPLQRRS